MGTDHRRRARSDGDHEVFGASRSDHRGRAGATESAKTNPLRGSAEKWPRGLAKGWCTALRGFRARYESAKTNPLRGIAGKWVGGSAGRRKTSDGVTFGNRKCKNKPIKFNDYGQSSSTTPCEGVGAKALTRYRGGHFAGPPLDRLFQPHARANPPSTGCHWRIRCAFVIIAG
jgi:hypothetical protein